MSKKKKHNTFDIFWLDTDMENMAYLFEYCNTYCKKLFKTEIDIEKFLNTFMRSNIRAEAESGHPRILSQAAEDTVEKFIEVDCNKNISQFKKDKHTKNNYLPNQLYWVGWVYSYIGYKQDIHFKDLVEILPIQEMLRLYHCGHEMDITVFYDHIKDVFKNKEKT